jgi:hypothetical protein
VTGRLTVDDDVVWYVWEGQSTDWLLGTATVGTGQLARIVERQPSPP